jgi:PAS domain S-box-containing protein
MNNLEEIAGISKSLIYIVDDNSQNAILLENLLSLSGYNNIWTTIDPEALLKKLSEKQPDLLLLDLMMPKISGFDILNEIKNQGEKIKFFPVIVVSADMEQKSRDKALSLGASDFVTKPFNFNEINLRIKNQLINKSLLNQLQETNDHLEEMVKERTEELLKAKEEAERNERKFRLLFESNLDEINLFHIDETGPGNFIESNIASEHILGYTKEELKSLSVKDIDIHMNSENFKTKFDLLKENGSISFETVVKRKDGNLRTVEVKATLIEIEGKLNVMNIYRDITEKAKYLETLLQQNKALKEIAWTQSHIVRAPLARMMAAIHLLQDTDIAKCDLETNEFLKIILSSVKEFDQIIREICEKSNQNQISFDH